MYFKCVKILACCYTYCLCKKINIVIYLVGVILIFNVLFIDA